MNRYPVFLDGISNARELGGLRASGKRVRPGVLLRTADLGHASPGAIEALHDTYQVQTVIDLRMSTERRAFPDPEVPVARNLHLAVMEVEEMSAGADPSLMDILLLPQTDRMALFEAFYASGLLNPRLYLQFLLTQRAKKAWTAFFHELLALEDGRALLWHCTDGKDRTGCAAMLVLSALGADRDTILGDYLMTNDLNARRLEAVRQKAGPLGWPQEKLEGLLFMSGGVHAAYMEEALAALESGYGSVQGYLREELDMGDAQCGELRRKFLC